MPIPQSSSDFLWSSGHRQGRLDWGWVVFGEFEAARIFFTEAMLWNRRAPGACDVLVEPVLWQRGKRAMGSGPRGRQGRPHSLSALLTAVVCLLLWGLAVPKGASSFTVFIGSRRSAAG